MEKFNLIFPIGGKGERFGGKFKAFIKIGDKTFIEKAVEPFLKWTEHIGYVHFIYYIEQEMQYKVSWRLMKMFDNKKHFADKICLHQLSKKEDSVCKAISSALESEKLENIIICDCDHSINVDPIFQYLFKNPEVDCLVPIWDLEGENIKNWSIACIDNFYNVSDIAEKKYPEKQGLFYGVIGCYFFREMPVFYEDNNYISDVIRDYIKSEKEVKAVKIKEAEFFGDPERLENYKLSAKKETDKKYIGTIFCDLDGTIIKHDEKGRDFELLPGAKEKLQEWRKKGYYIFITTGRKDTEEVAEYLLSKDVPYNYISGNLPSGERIVINDRKPHDPLKQMADSFEVDRDQGIKNIELDKKPKARILRRFRGGGFSDTLLIKQDDALWLRKIVKKDKNLDLGYSKLKKQYSELKRFNEIVKGITPEIFDESENSYEYYFDLEYMPFHAPLNEFDMKDRGRALDKLLNEILPEIYGSNQKTLSQYEGKSWLLDYLSEKIYPSLNNDKLNSEIVNQVRFCLDSIIKSKIFHPRLICPVCGDLTYENILYNKVSNDIRLIDLDGANTLDPPELDLGKLLQSTECNYEEWSKLDNPFTFSMNIKYPDKCEENKFIYDTRRIIEYYSEVFDYNIPETTVIGLFHLSLHLIRMIPFRFKVSDKQANFALDIAHEYLKSVSRSL